MKQIPPKYCLKCNQKIKRTIYPNGTREPIIKFAKRKYCSLYCARHSEEIKKILVNGKGGKAGNWKGGRNKRKDGYIEIWQPHHPFCSNKGYVMEHRLVMEKSLNRFLKPTEVVHHKNRIKSDNRTKNLRLFKNCGYHLSYHLKNKSRE